MTKLILIKISHTMIWVFFNVVIFYLLYAVVSNTIDTWAWVCIGLVLAEGMVLLLFKGLCPLTVMARHYSNSTSDNFDIYLPNWLAKYTKLIYSALFAAAVGRVIFRLIAAR